MLMAAVELGVVELDVDFAAAAGEGVGDVVDVVLAADRDDLLDAFF